MAMMTFKKITLRPMKSLISVHEITRVDVRASVASARCQTLGDNKWAGVDIFKLQIE